MARGRVAAVARVPYPAVPGVAPEAGDSALQTTIDSTVLTPSALARVRASLDPDVYAELAALVDDAVSRHFEPFLRGDRGDARVALDVAAARFAPLRMEFVRRLVELAAAEDLKELMRGTVGSVAELLDSDGWRLGNDAESLRRGVARYAEYVEYALAHVEGAGVPAPNPQLSEQLIAAATRVEFCLTAALLVLEGDVESDDVDPPRLSVVCRELDASVRTARGLLEELSAGAGGRRRGLDALAGAWGDKPGDDAILRQIYASRTIDAE